MKTNVQQQKVKSSVPLEIDEEQAERGWSKGLSRDMSNLQGDWYAHH